MVQVVGAGALAILLILIWTARSMVTTRRKLEQMREDLARATALGAEPASLRPRINLDVCIGTDACVEACPEKDVIGLVDGQAHLVNPTSCIGHGECLRACPVDAIELVMGSEKRGIDIPLLESDFGTTVPGLHIAGELGGMGLIYNAMTQGMQCVEAILRDSPRRVDGIHQLVIVGAGPGGLAASLAALEAKLDFVTLDQDSVGGTVLHYPRNKIVMTRPVTLPLYGKVQVSSVRKESLLEVWYDILETTGLQVRTGEKVDAVTRRDDGVFLVETAGGEQLSAQRVILAIGRRGTPRKLGIPGEELEKVTYRLLDADDYRGSRCLVVGGGDAGVEAAIALGEAGATTHLAHRRRVFDRIKAKNQSRLDEAVEKGRVKLLLEAKPQEISTDQVRIEAEGEVLTLPNDYVLVFAGGILPTAFLEAAGVEVQRFHGEVYKPAN